MSKTYIGTKIVKAESMSYYEFNSIDSELIKKSGGKPQDREGYKIEYEDGYKSWSPKEVFERCYREITESEKYLIL